MRMEKTNRADEHSSRDIYFQRIQNAGHRLTRARKEIISYVAQSTTPPTLRAIADHVAVNETSVYRVVSLCVELGIMEEVITARGVRRFAMLGDHHHHLICTMCERVAHIPCTGYEVREVPTHRDFVSATHHHVTWYGICTRCA